MSPPAVIRLENVSFGYDRSEVIRDATLTVEHGDFACIIGPNGGGKSTLLKLMVGQLTPQCGQVRVLGTAPEQARARIGYLPQVIRLDPQFPVTALGVVLMGRLRGGRFAPLGRADRARARDALREVGLADLERRHFAAMSGGQRQRVLIARALAGEPELLLLDEPASSLDINAEEQLYELLKELNRRLTVVVVSHDVAYVSKYVRTAICVNRHVHTHATRELAGEVIRNLFGREIRVVHHGG